MTEAFKLEHWDGNHSIPHRVQFTELDKTNGIGKNASIVL
jgi:hypothetical protein